MKVNELIEHLKKFPQDLEIYSPRSVEGGTIKKICMGRSPGSTEERVCLFIGYPFKGVEVEYPYE